MDIYPMTSTSQATIEKLTSDLIFWKWLFLHTLETRLSKFLFNYRITPHLTIGVSPAKVLMARKLRSTFNLLLQDLKAKVLQKQQQRSHDKSAKLRVFIAGDDVLVAEIPCSTEMETAPEVV